MRENLNNLKIDEIQNDALTILLDPTCNYDRTLLRILGQQYDRVIRIDNDDDVSERIRDLDSEESKIIVGNFRMNTQLYSSLGSRSFANLIFLRDPIRRVRSLITRLITDTAHPMHQEFVSQPLSSILVDGRLCNIFGISNGQVNSLSGLPTRVSCGTRLEKAEYHLRTNFSFFGLEHNSEEFLLICKLLFGWTGDVESFMEEDEQVELTEEQLSHLFEVNRFDLQLYGFAKGLYNNEFSFWSEKVKGMTLKTDRSMSDLIQEVVDTQVAEEKVGFFRKLGRRMKTWWSGS